MNINKYVSLPALNMSTIVNIFVVALLLRPAAIFVFLSLVISDYYIIRLLLHLLILNRCQQNNSTIHNMAVKSK